MVLTQCWQCRQSGSDQGDCHPYDPEAVLEPKPVIIVAPEDSTDTIENVEEDSNLGKEVIIVDESETKSLAVVAHQAIGERNTEESKPDLQKTEHFSVIYPGFYSPGKKQVF